MFNIFGAKKSTGEWSYILFNQYLIMQKST